MKKIDNLKAKTAEKLIKGFIDPEAVLQTDESTSMSSVINSTEDILVKAYLIG